MKPATASTAASLPARQAEHRESARVERIVDAADQRREREPEGHRRAAEHGDGEHDLGLRHPAASAAPSTPRRCAPTSSSRPEDDARDVSGVAAQRAEEERDPQSENVCSHSRPSTSLSPPASSMKRCSRVSSPRTSSIVPSAST